MTAMESGPGGGATPQEAFEGFRDAMEKADPGAVIRWVPPVERNRMILGLYAGLRFMAGFDEEIRGQLDAIAVKHGVLQPGDDTDMEDLGDPAKADAIGARMFEKADVFAYASDLLALNEPPSDDDEDAPPAPTGMEDLTIDGDTARALLVFEEERDEIRFVRVEGRWYVVME